MGNPQPGTSRLTDGAEAPAEATGPGESAQNGVPVLSGLEAEAARKILEGIMDPELRRAAIGKCLAGMPREQWKEWMDEVVSGGRKMDTADISGMARFYTMRDDILGSIAVIDPVGFMAVQNSKGELNNDGEGASRMLIMMQWAGHNPKAAKAFLTAELARERPAPGLSDSARLMAGLLIRQGDTGVFEWVATLPQVQRAEAAAAAISEMAVTDSRGAAARLVEFQSLPERDNTYTGWNAGHLAKTIAGEMAKTDPEEALTWAAAQPAALQKKAIEGALSDWVKRDFEGALAAVSSLPAEVSGYGLKELIGKAPPERLGEMAVRVEQQPEGASRAEASLTSSGEALKSP